MNKQATTEDRQFKLHWNDGTVEITNEIVIDEIVKDPRLLIKLEAGKSL